MSRGAHDKLVCLAALAAVAVHSVAAPRAPAAVPLAATGASVAIALGARLSGEAARSLAAMLACLALASVLPVLGVLPALGQLTMALALLAFVLTWRVDAALRPPPSWRARGSVPPGWTALVGGVTPLALSAWVLLFRPDLHDVVDRYVPDLPLPLLIAGGFAFALVNAALEELIWRGVIQDRLEPVFGPRAAIALQAASFGLQHWHGVPRGVVGALLAGIWALMLGALRRHAGGLLAPFLAHVVADLAVAGIIIVYAR